MSDKNSILKKENYMKWIGSLCDDYRKSQIKAAISVNSELLKFYWKLGKDIHEIHLKSKWGNSFFTTLSRDLKNRIPNAKCFSERNLRYMKSFYELFSDEKISISNREIEVLHIAFQPDADIHVLHLCQRIHSFVFFIYILHQVDRKNVFVVVFQKFFFLVFLHDVGVAHIKCLKIIAVAFGIAVHVIPTEEFIRTFAGIAEFRMLRGCAASQRKRYRGCVGQRLLHVFHDPWHDGK